MDSLHIYQSHCNAHGKNLTLMCRLMLGFCGLQGSTPVIKICVSQWLCCLWLGNHGQDLVCSYSKITLSKVCDIQLLPKALALELRVLGGSQVGQEWQSLYTENLWAGISFFKPSPSLVTCLVPFQVAQEVLCNH